MAASISAPAFEPRSALEELTIRLEELRLDLIELAFAYDRRGRSDAADVATQIAGRIGRLLGPAEASVSGTAHPDTDASRAGTARSAGNSPLAP